MTSDLDIFRTANVLIRERRKKQSRTWHPDGDTLIMFSPLMGSHLVLLGTSFPTST
jgi:hypothetical protein